MNISTNNNQQYVNSMMSKGNANVQDVPTIEKIDPNQENIEQNNSNKKEEVSDEMINSAINDLNKAVQSTQKSLQFELHDESDRTMVKVVDLQQDKVIKEIPSKEVLDMVGRIKEMVGVIIDEKI